VEKHLKQRLLLYAFNLGLSFAILVLFINNLDALAVVIVLVTVAVIVASASDLKELEKDKGLLGFAILCAIFVFGVSYYIYQFFVFLFYGLVLIDVATLAGYVVMKRSARYAEDSGSI
jgi:hypothetical protein